MKKEKIIITIGEPFIARNLFATKWWLNFITGIDDKYEIIVLTYSKDIENFRERFGYKNINFIAVLPKFKNNKLTNIILSLMRSCLSTKTNQWSKMRAYYRKDSTFISTQFKNIFSKIFGNLSFIKKILRKVMIKCVSAETKKIIKEINPSFAIITSITNFDFDVPIAASCRSLGIKIIGLPRSWDNFTSHGLTRVMPDFLLVQNKYLAEMAVKHQVYDSVEQIKIFGVPSYDNFFKNDVYSKEELYNMLGLELNYNYIIYGAMGSFLFKNEEYLPEILNNTAKVLNNNIKIVYRMHPKFPIPNENRTGLEFLIFDKKKDSVVNANMDENEMKYLRSLIYYSKLVVTSASTFAIDAAVCGKPLLLINFDPKTSTNYWESVNRFFDHYDHFEEFVKLAKPVIINNPDKLSQVIEKTLNSTEINYDRKAVIDAFVEPYDGNSGKRLAESMLNIIK